MAYLNTTSAAGNGLAARAASSFENLAIRYKRYRLFRETFEGLNALTHRDLADLGLHRSELRNVAWESAEAAFR